MTDSTPPFNPAAALAEHLAGRVRAAAKTVTAAAEAIGRATPPGGFTPAVVNLRRLLDELSEQAVVHDLYAGPGLAAVAEALGVTERTARTRYKGGPRDLPLLIAVDED